MNKLSKEKRDKLILVCMGFGAVLLLIGLMFIRPEYAAIKSIQADTTAKQQKLANMQDTINKASTLTNALRETSATLAQSESDMATGDPNAWIYDTIRGFKTQYKMDISIASPTSIGDVDLIPKFPYKQLKVSVNGTAYYHDLGKFIASFENNYPHGRICNLLIHPSGDGEKLSFSMDIVALIKPSQS